MTVVDSSPAESSEPTPQPGWGARVMILLVRGYQRFVSPPLHFVLGPWCGCRFSPTCSEYARQALVKHGFFRGSWLAIRRILRCHPWNPGGIDEVP
ncbi:MAG: membrane protein insertion efficiency factor YidD [Puniceicoccales bacterium]|jgi:putative membrane protein insertion efficiency factor|nr:membrane protein insertion efficiency factor YidD [Puniceicoccales bacterium]